MIDKPASRRPLNLLMILIAAAGLLGSAVIPGSAATTVDAGMSPAVAPLATHVHYYFQYMGPDYVGGGYALKVKFKSTKVYITDFATDRCYTATRIKANTWRYRQPIASDTGEWVTGKARTNSAHSWFKMYDQYGNPRTFQSTTLADANAWLADWNESNGTNHTWSNPPC